MVPDFGPDTRALPTQSASVQEPKGAGSRCPFPQAEAVDSKPPGIDRGSRGFREPGGFGRHPTVLPVTIARPAGAESSHHAVIRTADGEARHVRVLCRQIVPIRTSS